MSDAQAARKRDSWMPNRMFDPVANPFAIQNLLEKEVPAFTELRDERPQSVFGIDPLAGGVPASGFALDQALQFPDEEEVAAPFVADADTAAGDFSAEPATDAPAFVAEAQAPAADHAAAADDTAADDAPAAAELALPVTEASAAQEAATAEAAAPSADLPAPESAPAIAQAETETDTDTEAAPVSAPTSVPDSEAVAQMIAAARADAYAEGLQAGREQGLAEGRELERPAARQQGYDEGFAAGAADARATADTDEQQQRAQAQQEKLDRLQAVIDALQQLAGDADGLFEPVKKLAIHLAEQLVRGELAQSPQAISRLVDNALRELNASGDKPVVVHLHPEDLEAYRPTVAQFADSLILRPDNLLSRGSVRASLDGSVVEDLIQRRVAGLKQSLAQPAAPGWRSGNRLSDRLAEGERGSRHVEDVTPVEKAERIAEAAPSDGHA